MPTNDNPHDLIGSLEAAAILGIDRATFNRWAARGDVKPVVTAPSKVGARLFHRADIEALAKERAAA